ncbi:organelle biogenesis, muted-like protein domain-containing protein [Phthorimaea operculella]|nr:organelle biogenesis, muted-like protein domain-containing protein [Phthorimaea operculella]
MTELSREIGEVWARLFDHRPFLNGEIKFMLKEFEEKRGDREVENLFAILEKLTEIKDTQVDKIRKGGEALPVLNEKLEQVLQLCDGVEKNYLEHQKIAEQKRIENRKKREKEWDQFIDDMNFKCKRIDNAFEEKEEELRDFDNVPENILKFGKSSKDALGVKHKKNNTKEESFSIKFTDKDIENLSRIKDEVKKVQGYVEDDKLDNDSTPVKTVSDDSKDNNKKEVSEEETKSVDSDNTADTTKDQTKSSDSATDVSSLNSFEEILPEKEGPFLHTSDIAWLYEYLEKIRKTEKDVPYLHELFEGTEIDTPRNSVLKRNPVLEARCVKLRSQQEAREYRKMTRGVDNVRIRFPDDTIAYQLKQINRQLIAIGQFIISIFAGFLFGFKGVEWMIGPMDFGFRLLLGVMCALIIALAEIYFLAKKLNEELSVPETTQLGGPPQFVDKKTYGFEPRAKKEPAYVVYFVSLNTCVLRSISAMEEQVPFKVFTFWSENGRPEVRRFGIEKSMVTSFVYLNAKLQEIYPGLKNKTYSVTWKGTIRILLSIL